MAVPDLPDERTRWRCSRCGNLTRFDVSRVQKVDEFWHFELSGEPNVEERNVQSDDVLAVKCRWCGVGAEIELIARVDD
jgi:RNase P subunit RPR2